MQPKAPNQLVLPCLFVWYRDQLDPIGYFTYTLVAQVPSFKRRPFYLFYHVLFICHYVGHYSACTLQNVYFHYVFNLLTRLFLSFDSLVDSLILTGRWPQGHRLSIFLIGDWGWQAALASTSMAFLMTSFQVSWSRSHSSIWAWIEGLRLSQK